MKQSLVVVCALLILFSGCSESDVSVTAATDKIEGETSGQSASERETTFQINITDKALPVLKTALESAAGNDAVLYSMEWPAGVCSTQHHLEIGPPTAAHEVTTVSGVRVAYSAKYKQFVDGTVIDFGTRGSEAGFKLENSKLDLYSIVHSESDSDLMTEMLGDGFANYRESVLSGDIILEPKSNDQ